MFGMSSWSWSSAPSLTPSPSLSGLKADVRAFCDANHHRLAGPSWEIYGHWLPEWNADPSRIRTDVFYLLSDA